MKKLNKISFTMQNAVYDEMPSPVGRLTIITSTAGLHAILWENDQRHSYLHQLSRSKTDKIIIETKKQLNEYFSGQRKTFALPIVFDGTDFQRQAWEQLQKIPFADTISYAEQAEKIGGKNKARAVGLANGLNPIPIVVPCHRVIGSNGRLTGFAGGLDRKAYLLNWEKQQSVFA